KPTLMVIVEPCGALPVGPKLNTRLPGPTLFTWTWKPAACSVCSAWWTPMPRTSGTATCGGPGDTYTVTTSPDWIGEPAAGDWRMMVPDGWSLLAACTGLML